MPRKRNPILGKAWDLIALTITPMAKVKKPISRKLPLFKRTKIFKPFRHHNYTFIREYEFSPSNTPLFIHPRDPAKKRSRLLCLLCGRNGGESIAEGGIGDELEILSVTAGEVGGELPEILDSSDEEDDSSSVDLKAEKFIKRFYDEMRIQRQESIMQYQEMLTRSSA